MSMTQYLKSMTPTRVKTKEREDIDLDKLVKHGATRIVQPPPSYPDLTDLPTSRGDAIRRLHSLSQAQDPELFTALLQLPPAQAFDYLKALGTPASKRDDSTTRKEQVPPAATTSKPTPTPEASK